MSPIQERLARVRLTIGQIQVLLLICFIGMAVSLAVSIAAFDSRVSVARHEAQRAEQASIATESRVLQGDCGLLDLLRPHPADPPITTARGRLIATRAQTAWDARGCR